MRLDKRIAQLFGLSRALRRQPYGRARWTSTVSLVSSRRWRLSLKHSLSTMPIGPAPAQRPNGCTSFMRIRRS